MIKQLTTHIKPLNKLIFKYVAIFIIFLCYLTWSFSFIYSLTWIDKSFPGFLLHKNLIISKISIDTDLLDYPNNINEYTDKVIAINGKRVNSIKEVNTILSSYKLGTFIDFSILRNDEIFEFSSPLILFKLEDYLSIFGLSYFIGIVCIIIGVSIYYLRPNFNSSKIFFLFCSSVGVWFIGYFDSQSTYIFSNLSILGSLFAPTFMIYLGTVFPRNNLFNINSTFLIIPFIVFSILLFIIHLNYENNIGIWSFLHKTISVYFVLASLFLLSAYIYIYAHSANKLEKQRTQIILTGTLIGLTLPLSILSISNLFDKNLGWNLFLFLFMVYPISLSYSILKHKLFDVNVIIRKALVYGFLTGLVGGIIAILIVSFNLFLTSQSGWKNPIFFIILSAFLAVALIPLQNKIQAFIDLIFFRQKIDYRKTIEDISYAMTSILNTPDIKTKIIETIDNTIFAKNVKIFLYDQTNNNYKLYVNNINPDGQSGILAIDSPLIQYLINNKTEIFLEDIYSEDKHIRNKSTLKEIFNMYDSSLFIPMFSKDKLIGVLSLGDKKSYLSYTSEDIELLRILANQSSIAIENALAFKLVEDYANKLEDMNIELKETQAQLIQSEKMSAIGQLAAGIAHEIRNPLNIIEGARYYLSHFLSSSEKTDAVNEYLNYIKQEVDRTNKLISSLLKFSKSESTRFELVDINHSLDTAVVLLKKQFSDNSVRCFQEFDPNLPEIYGDANQLWQVFVNIIINALQAMPDGGNLTIKTYKENSDNSIWISFKDTGIGMDQETLNKIFDPFFTKKDNGTGLGLSISYRIIDNHKGNFKVESQRGVGTNFQIHLPLIQEFTEIDKDSQLSGDNVYNFNV